MLAAGQQSTRRRGYGCSTRRLDYPKRHMRRIPHPTPAGLLAVAALFVALGGTGAAIATSAIPDASGVFHGCVDRKTGTVRLVTKASQCRKAQRSGKHKGLGEFAVSWSQTGPAGANGIHGTNGTNGAPGASATRWWASVQNTEAGVPSVLHGEGVTSVSHKFTGQTKVTFNQDVSRCAFQATLVGPGGGYYTPPNEITVFTGFYEGSGLTNRDVVVNTLHSNSLANGYNFAITAFC
jgi:hypothetical protein